MKNNFNLCEQCSKIIGIFFIILGIFCNKYFFGKFFSIYAIVELNKRMPIWFLQCTLIVLGLIFILIKTKSIDFKKASEYYKVISMAVLTVLILFLFINLFVYSVSIIKDLNQYKSQIFLNNEESFNNLFPSLNRNEIEKLLQDTWSRSFVYEPYTQFKEKPFSSKYVNVSQYGFRMGKNQGPWPPKKENFNIFLFGGSSVFSYGLPDDCAIPSYLQEFFSKGYSKEKIYVYNFGRGYYTSSQERILFEKLLTSGFIPNVAIFIDGLNDFYFYNDKPIFTGRLKLLFNKSFLATLPISRFVNNLRKKCEKKYDDLSLIDKVINRYLTNKKIIEAVSNTFDIKTFFVWQPVPTYKYDLKYHKFAKSGFGDITYSQYGYPRMAEVIKRQNLGNNFLWLADIQENKHKQLYIDIDHYSPELSKEIAENVYNFLIGKGIR